MLIKFLRHKIKTTSKILKRLSYQLHCGFYLIFQTPEAFFEKNKIEIAKKSFLNIELLKQAFAALARCGHLDLAYQLKFLAAAKYIASHETMPSPQHHYEKLMSHFFLQKTEQLDVNIQDWENCDDKLTKARAHELNLFVRLLSPVTKIDGLENYKQSITLANPNIDFDENCLEAQYNRLTQLFKGKKIALVGPAKINENDHDGINLDSHDVVIRLNILENSFKNGKGQITTVVYYNAVTANRWSKKIEQFLNETGAIPVFNTWELCLKFKKYNPILSNFYIKPFLSQHNFFNAIPRIVWDVIKHNPSQFKIFNTSFFMTDYNEDYLRGSNEKFNLYIKLGGVGLSHDPLQGFYFLKLLFERSYFTMDKQGTIAIKTSLNDYKNYLIALNKAGKARI